YPHRPIVLPWCSAARSAFFLPLFALCRGRPSGPPPKYRLPMIARTPVPARAAPPGILARGPLHALVLAPIPASPRVRGDTSAAAPGAVTGLRSGYADPVRRAPGGTRNHSRRTVRG